MNPPILVNMNGGDSCLFNPLWVNHIFKIALTFCLLFYLTLGLSVRVENREGSIHLSYPVICLSNVLTNYEPRSLKYPRSQHPAAKHCREADTDQIDLHIRKDIATGNLFAVLLGTLFMMDASIEIGGLHSRS